MISKANKIILALILCFAVFGTVISMEASETTEKPQTETTAAADPEKDPEKDPEEDPEEDDETEAESEEEITIGSIVTVGSLKYMVTSKSAVAVKSAIAVSSALAIPEMVTIQGRSYRVTNIQNRAFKGNTTITSLKIGRNMKRIGIMAFMNCTNLKTVTIGNDVEMISKAAFRGCTALKRVTIGSGLRKIGIRAFFQDKKLAQIAIKSSQLAGVELNAVRGISENAVILVPGTAVESSKALFTETSGFLPTMKVNAIE